jgi:hypothetical protein
MVKKPFSNINGGQKSQPILLNCLTAIDLSKQQRRIFISPHSTLSTMRRVQDLPTFEHHLID